MELDEIKAEYYKTLTELFEANDRTVEEIYAEIKEVMQQCGDIEDILIKSSEIL